MRRRDFITLLGGMAAWPLTARAQPGRLPIIGFLGGGTRDSARTWVAAFEQRLRELGWTEGRTVTIRYRWAEGHNERMAEIAAEFVRIKANVIAAYGTQAALAAKQATADIPIVFTLPGDPVGTGLVASLARPGGNVTGLSSQTTDLSGKRLEVLREIVPGLRRLAIMANVDNPANAEDMKETQAMARAAGLDVAVPIGSIHPRCEGMWSCGCAIRESCTLASSGPVFFPHTRADDVIYLRPALRRDVPKSPSTPTGNASAHRRASHFN